MVKTEIDVKILAEVWNHADEIYQDTQLSDNEIREMIPAIQNRLARMMDLLDPYVTEEDVLYD